MTTIIQPLYEEITNDLRTLKSDKDKDRVIFINLLQMFHFLIYDVYNINIDMEFLIKVEVIKQ